MSLIRSNFYPELVGATTNLPSLETPIDPYELRKALGFFATGVTVITAIDNDGSPIGLTCNSFNSVSMSPPLILWSLRRESKVLHDFVSATYFAVNVLTDKQIHISQKFSKSTTDKFSGLEYVSGVTGAPLLPDSAVILECQKEHHYDGGDHVIFVGRVLKFSYELVTPLVYQNGQYARAQPISI